MRFVVLVIEELICLSLILIFWLSKKSPRIIVTLFTSILRTINLSKNSLISINMAEEDRVVDRSIFDGMIKNLLKFQKFKNIKNLSKVKRLEQTF